MPEDNFLECIKAIAETMKGTRWVGEWYGKCFSFSATSPAWVFVIHIFIHFIIFDRIYEILLLGE